MDENITSENRTAEELHVVQEAERASVTNIPGFKDLIMLSLPGKETPSEELDSGAVVNPHSARPFVSTAAGSNTEKTQLGNIRQTQDTLPLTERRGGGQNLGRGTSNNNRNSDILFD